MADTIRDVVIKVAIEAGKYNAQSFKAVADRIKRELQDVSTVNFYGGSWSGHSAGGGSSGTIGRGGVPPYHHVPPGSVQSPNPTQSIPPGQDNYRAYSHIAIERERAAKEAEDAKQARWNRLAGAVQVARAVGSTAMAMGGESAPVDMIRGISALQGGYDIGHGIAQMGGMSTRAVVGGGLAAVGIGGLMLHDVYQGHLYKAANIERDWRMAQFNAFAQTQPAGSSIRAAYFRQLGDLTLGREDSARRAVGAAITMAGVRSQERQLWFDDQDSTIRMPGGQLQLLQQNLHHQAGYGTQMEEYAGQRKTLKAQLDMVNAERDELLNKQKSIQDVRGQRNKELWDQRKEMELEFNQGRTTWYGGWLPDQPTRYHQNRIDIEKNESSRKEELSATYGDLAEVARKRLVIEEAIAKVMAQENQTTGQMVQSTFKILQTTTAKHENNLINIGMMDPGELHYLSMLNAKAKAIKEKMGQNKAGGLDEFAGVSMLPEEMRTLIGSGTEGAAVARALAMQRGAAQSFAPETAGELGVATDAFGNAVAKAGEKLGDPDQRQVAMNVAVERARDAGNEMGRALLEKLQLDELVNGFKMSIQTLEANIQRLLQRMQNGQ